MEILACAHCGAALTRPVTRARLPPHAHHPVGNGHPTPVLTDAGAYAVDPEPSGVPWRRREELAAGEAAARGSHVPVSRVPAGPFGRVLLAPGDATGPAERCTPYGPDLPLTGPRPTSPSSRCTRYAY
ncbi:hypothetical protein Kpho02_38810 [Kitasatospora phosalacinea]|uniref:Uncharacterized protein n=1 Tax=Kitasatospora phosalacinea TaxID=2065 RepID=A0A9W6V3T3_9ACTN|nr:hypothetical protein [Kitasatospora phosalacinea]GLW71582.1 hypothetical protein Kpho02_38810 [Kitasatospora phosalacinea]